MTDSEDAPLRREDGRRSPIMAINYGRPGYPAIDGSCTGSIISFSSNEVSDTGGQR